MRLSAEGITADLPPGWEGVIGGGGGDPVAQAEGPTAGRPRLPVAHLANFQLPGRRGDFGSGAVEAMRNGDAFVALVEYGRESVGTPLFAAQGLPRSVPVQMLSSRALQRTLGGQVGMQRFFTEGGRAFCLYVVLAGAEQGTVARTVRDVDRVLERIALDKRP